MLICHPISAPYHVVKLSMIFMQGTIVSAKNMFILFVIRPYLILLHSADVGSLTSILMLICLMIVHRLIAVHMISKHSVQPEAVSSLLCVP